MGRAQEWVEAAGSTVDVAVEAALAELGLSSRDEAEIEVISEGKTGILGSSWRAQEAVVKVTAKPKQRKRRRRGRGRSSRGQDGSTQGDPKPQRSGRPAGSAKSNKGTEATKATKANGSRGDQRSQSRSSGQGGSKQGAAAKTERPSNERASGNERAKRSRRDSGRDDARRRQDSSRSGARNGPGEEPTIEEQATIAAEFLRGLLKAFGLEGEVATSIDEDILRIEVTGDQTEALVGRKGVVMQSVLEITRTVVQRKTFGAPRMRIDINGYGERRREALRIYAGRQAERVKEDGVEIMLEPMNAADRKVVHDAIGEIESVRSYSEGEDPERAVVIAMAEGYTPSAAEQGGAEGPSADDTNASRDARMAEKDAEHVETDDDDGDDGAAEEE